MARLINVTCIERAFELARSGAVQDVEGIKRRLNAEGYNGYQIEGRTLRAQLRMLIAKALKEQVEEQAGVAHRL